MFLVNMTDEEKEITDALLNLMNKGLIKTSVDHDGEVWFTAVDLKLNL